MVIMELQNPEITWYQDTRTLISSHLKISRFTDSQIHRFTDSRISTIQEFQNHWIPESL